MGSILKNSKSGIIDIGSNTIRLCLYTNKKSVLDNYYTQKDYFGLQKYIYNNVDPIKSIMKIPESYQLLGFVTAGIEGKASSIKKNVPKKKITHYEYFNK